MARGTKFNNGAAIQERLFWALNQHWRDYLIFAHECTLSAPARAVHGLRTTIRKVNATLELIGVIEKSKPAQKLQKQFKKILNSARDLRDLQIQEKWVSGETESGAIFLRGFQDDLHFKVKKERRRFIRTITHRNIARRLKKQERWIHAIGARMLKSSKAFRQKDQTTHVTLLCIERLVDELRKKSAAAQKADLESVHAVRIALKRYRYAIDALGSTYPISPETLEQMDMLQKQLGLVQDVAVLIESLKKSRHKTKLKQYLLKLQRQLNENVAKFLEGRELLIEKIVDISAFYLKTAA